MAQRQEKNIARFGVYAFLVIMAAFFLMPLYVMVATSLKTMDEVRGSSIFAFPLRPTLEAWATAWNSACTGLTCAGVSVGFFNSLKIMIPSTFLSIMLGAVTGYALSFWRPKGAGVIFAVLVVAAFIPYQVFIYPLVRVLSQVGLYNSLGGIIMVHVIFGLPIMVLMFRNYYAGLPRDLFSAARVDGGGFWDIFFRLMLPLSPPIMIVAVILQSTHIWNDFLFGLVFAGSDNRPMTVLLNNIVNTTQGEKAYNVDMAATILTALVPLVIYLASGRWFVRGIAAGAVKG
ncbi:carbohydrate ABC transporter permease [Rhizobium sp. C4]|uniref:carbohydrate ABC transporter permease n=1 Tax=Rhizobium sp. C4 TaxID=1349800 RepID=UPI001E3B728C|nr:carbohydrate ABC transporter permease [Rhizobium sp. C4]MCD2171445.1 carbohydrate ABC transporter permease [Rhizobium sp. C4]